MSDFAQRHPRQRTNRIGSFFPMILPSIVLPRFCVLCTAISQILRSLRKLFSIEFLLPNDLAFSSPSFTSFPSVKSVFIPGCSLWLRLRCPVFFAVNEFPAFPSATSQPSRSSQQSFPTHFPPIDC